MKCPYCTWTGTPEEYSKHYDKCPNRPKTPGRSLSESSSPESKVSGYVPGETFTLMYTGGIKGESIRLIEKLKEEPTREYWLYEVVSDHSRHENWFPKRHGSHHSSPEVGALSLKVIAADIQHMLELMREAALDRNFENFLKVGEELFVSIGRLYQLLGTVGVESLFNAVAIAMLDAYKGNWEDAYNFIRKATEDLQRKVNQAVLR
jgi:hypothetical protein